MADAKKITAFVGQPVHITLQSMSGSTGYSWYLTNLDGGLALSCTNTAASAPGIAPVNQTFDFLAAKEGNYKVVFQLMAPWRPGESGDEAVYEVEVSPPEKSAAADISKAMDGKEFTNARMVNTGDAATASSVLKYAVPMSYGGLNTNAAAQVIYAAPMVQSAPINAMSPTVVYAAPMAQSSPSSVAAMFPTVVYAAPMAQSSPGSVAAMFPTVVYAAPMMQAQQFNAAMPQVIYAAPMSQSVAATAPITVLYAAPMTAGPGPLYAAPMSQATILYAAPMVQSAPIIVRYAAPFTGNGCC